MLKVPNKLHFLGNLFGTFICYAYLCNIKTKVKHSTERRQLVNHCREVMKYNRTRIENLDPRQCEYVKMHTENYGTDQLVINGKTYAERCEELRPTDEDIKAVLANYPDREAFLWNNMRGWTIVFKTKINEKMFRWNQMEKIQ